MRPSATDAYWRGPQGSQKEITRKEEEEEEIPIGLEEVLKDLRKKIRRKEKKKKKKFQ
jgi:hypothetical protein